MRLHVVGLPHTQLTDEYSWCAYTQKVRRFADMMAGQGHEVFTYAPGLSMAGGTHVPTTGDPWSRERIPPFESGHEAWTRMAVRTVTLVRERSEKDDFLCLIAGLAQKPIADALPDLVPVEFGIGYGGTFTAFRVFESYAWMHVVYGAQTGGDSHAADGKFYDAVIPNSYHPAEFPAGDGRGGYVLYMGRVIERKGLEIACETARRADRRLLVAGEGDRELVTYGEYLGNVGPDRRAVLLGGAAAVFVPTLYVEPFGGIAAEAMLTGTPVLTTDWGAFTETVKHGTDGYRCRDLGEFQWALENAHLLNRRRIRQRALGRFSTEVVRWDYERYFERVQGLYEGRDFYTARVRRPYVAP